MREPVFRAATEVANTLTAGIRDLHDPTNGPVTTWSSDQLRSVVRPTMEPRTGRELPLVHHAALARPGGVRPTSMRSPRWLEADRELSGVSGSAAIDWTLGDADARPRALEDVRTRAVEDAFAKARSLRRGART